MSFWKLLKGLKYRQLTSLSILLFKHPLLMYGTIRATTQTMVIAQDKFPGIHGKHNQANAFRHALWNVLILKKCAKMTKNTERVVSWTKKITDWHEDFSPNEALARAMDLHNNYVGRTLFLKLENKTEKEIVEELILKLKNAIQIQSLKDFDKAIFELVFIEHD